MANRARRTTGLTLIETTLVVATIALLVGLAVPAVRSLIDSFESEAGTRSVIQAALNSARAMAMSRQRYVGVRFQKACASDDPLLPLKGLRDAPQYMIFIMHDEPKNLGGLGGGFRAIEGLEPIRLPDTTDVMDLSGIGGDADIDEPRELSNATTFSIVFSPSGKLIVQDVRVRNRQGYVDDTSNTEVSMDTVFNKKSQVDAGVAMFYQDDYFGAGWSPYPDLGLGKESSRTSFVLCDRRIFDRAYANKTAWTDCLLDASFRSLYVSPYTGELISAKK